MIVNKLIKKDKSRKKTKKVNIMAFKNNIIEDVHKLDDDFSKMLSQLNNYNSDIEDYRIAIQKYNNQKKEISEDIQDLITEYNKVKNEQRIQLLYETLWDGKIITGKDLEDSSEQLIQKQEVSKLNAKISSILESISDLQEALEEKRNNEASLKKQSQMLEETIKIGEFIIKEIHDAARAGLNSLHKAEITHVKTIPAGIEVSVTNTTYICRKGKTSAQVGDLFEGKHTYHCLRSGKWIEKVSNTNQFKGVSLERSEKLNKLLNAYVDRQKKIK